MGVDMNPLPSTPNTKTDKEQAQTDRTEQNQSRTRREVPGSAAGPLGATDLYSRAARSEGKLL